MPVNLPEKLFHYTSADAALELLKSNKLAGISAEQLDGVLELNSESSVSFDKAELTEAVVKNACGMIFGSETPAGDSALIAAIQRWREAERFSDEDEAKNVLQGLCSKMVDQAYIGIERDLKKWPDFCRHFRILKLSEKLDNFYLWQSQAENFSGVAIRLSIDEKNPVFENLNAIKYINVRPEITSIREQVEAVIKGAAVDCYKEVESKFLLKAPTFQREKEWRCFKQCDKGNEQDSTFDLGENCVRALYLGPAISAEIKEQLVTAAAETHPKLKIAQLQFAQGRFDLSL